jgi:hypothetical protein
MAAVEVAAVVLVAFLVAAAVDNGAVGVTRERLKVTFGYALTNLWSRARSVVGEEQYAKWDVDVPATYLADEYELDPVTGRPKFTIVGGKITFNKTHSMGDIQYDSDGKIIYRYVKGDVKRDAYGKPIVTNTRGVVRQMDLSSKERLMAYSSPVTHSTSMFTSS